MVYAASREAGTATAKRWSHSVPGPSICVRNAMHASNSTTTHAGAFQPFVAVTLAKPNWSRAKSDTNSSNDAAEVRYAFSATLKEATWQPNASERRNPKQASQRHWNPAKRLGLRSQRRTPRIRNARPLAKSM